MKVYVVTFDDNGENPAQPWGVETVFLDWELAKKYCDRREMDLPEREYYVDQYEVEE